MKWVLFLCCLNYLPLSCSAANIVVYTPLPFYSHQIFFKPLWLELAKRGHKITLIQCDITIENNENITNIVLNETYTFAEKSKTIERFAKGESLIKINLSALQTIKEGLEYQLSHPGVQELLRGRRKVDLFFTEYLVSVGIFLGRKFNAPMIGMVPMDASQFGHMAMGNPTHPVMYPDKDLLVSDDMTFMDRVRTSVFWMGLMLLEKFVLHPLQEDVVKKCLGDSASIEEVTKDLSLLFVNANPLFNTVRPMGFQTINIGGGFHMQGPQPLTKELQDYLDNAENGVIYFSFGTSFVSNTMTNTTQDLIMQTFSQLPYKVLCRLETEPAGVAENIKVVKWVPQQDVLRHKNIKLFITQGGLQSMEEAIFNYVPIVALPFFGDQHSNSRKMAAKGFGLVLDHIKLDVETFKNAILEVINNPLYKEKTKELVDRIKDQPMTGLEKAVWWTEYVLRHGHTNAFRNPSIELPWYQYWLLDVLSFFLLIVTAVVYVFIKLFQLVKGLVRKKTKTSYMSTKKKFN